MNLAITSVSTKGQIVIPNFIRKQLKITKGSKLMVFTDGTNLLIKPITPPDKKTFRKIIHASRSFVKKAGIKRSDMKKIIEKVRHDSCHRH